MREAEDGPVYPILARFHDIHADADAIKHFEVFRDVIFDVNGQYHVAVPLYIPKDAPTTTRRCSARRIASANLCYALEGKGILARPISFLPSLVALAPAQAPRQQVRRVLRRHGGPPATSAAGTPCGRCGRRRRRSSGRPSRSTASGRAPGRR